jgi:hypothetical protein
MQEVFSMYKKLNVILIVYLTYSYTSIWASEEIYKNPVKQLNSDKSIIFDFHNLKTDNLIYIADKERGPECPTGSGEYCTAESNYCCSINNVWTCVAELKDCKDD